MAAGVLLGNIQFVAREVPAIIKFGGHQMLAIHKQIGGRRVIDAMGPDPIAIPWSGKFYGTSAATRARLCDALRQSGSQVNLSWGSFTYAVVVSHFEADYKHEWEISYSIACEVISDGPPQTFTPTLDSAVSSDLAAIANIATAAPGLPAVAGATSINAVMSAAIVALQNVINTATGN